MMKKLLFILFITYTINISAQATINIDWTFGSNPTVASTAPNYTNRTIEVGDTINWLFNGTGTHTVTSSAGSTETWDSGLIASGTGVMYSKTFTVIGTNPYVCTPHSGNMNGTITVVADGTLDTPKFIEPISFSIYPNPGNNVMNISMEIEDLVLIEVFDVLGKKIYSQNLNKLTTSINISKWNSGLYLVKLTLPNKDISITKRFIKL